MTDRPIIFSAPMVRALLAGTKTQTRRVLKPQPSAYPGAMEPPPSLNERHPAAYFDAYNGGPFWCSWDEYDRQGPDWIRIRFAAGDRLWVRETWCHDGFGVWTIADARSGISSGKPIYRATDARQGVSWWSSIHMPREFSRLTLTVSAVKVERLQDISEEDALAEGMPDFVALCEQFEPGSLNTAGETSQEISTRLLWPQRWYETVWSEIHGPDAWAANPWVAAISFTVERRNIDQVGVAAVSRPARGGSIAPAATSPAACEARHG